MKKNSLLIFTFILILFPILSFEAKASCTYLDSGTSRTLGEKGSHCITLPIYSDKPLVIVQYEEANDSFNRFNIGITDSINKNATIKESFTSSGSVSINRSFYAAKLGEVILKIKPEVPNRNSNVKVMYGDIGGIFTVFIHNKNTSNTVMIEDVISVKGKEFAQSLWAYL